MTLGAAVGWSQGIGVGARIDRLGCLSAKIRIPSPLSPQWLGASSSASFDAGVGAAISCGAGT